MGCCPSEKQTQTSCHSSNKKDWAFIISSSLCAIHYISYLFGKKFLPAKINHFSHHIFDLLNVMWWGIALGVLMVGLLNFVPRNAVISIIGHPTSKRGILKATFAGLLLDLCNHGILMVAMKLYNKGASLAQVFAFLIASPWNSFSLTLILLSLIGIKLTFYFILGSAFIAILTGYIVRFLLLKGYLKGNPNSIELPKSYNLKKDLQVTFGGKFKKMSFYKEVISGGFKESKMIMKWLFIGTILAAVLKTFIDDQVMLKYVGPTLSGMGLTLVAATIIEVCSEGSTPIAADLVTRANAPGNGFAFLMTGAATDYTEIMSIKSTTGKWMNSLILPILTVPQIIVLGLLINHLR